MSGSLRPHRLYSPWNSLGQNTGAGSLFLLQGIFPTQGSNLGLLHCRRILYQLSPWEALPLSLLPCKPLAVWEPLQDQEPQFLHLEPQRIHRGWYWCQGALWWLNNMMNQEFTVVPGTWQALTYDHQYGLRRALALSPCSPVRPLSGALLFYRVKHWLT